MTQLKDNRNQPIKAGDRVIYMHPTDGLVVCKISKIKAVDTWNSIYNEVKTSLIIHLRRSERSYRADYWCRSTRNLTLINSGLIDLIKH